MNEKTARTLTRKIQQGYWDLETLLTQAIVENIWIPLGYGTFTEWYDAEMRDIELARGARNVVVVTLFAEKSTTKITDREIGEMVGVSTSAVKELKRSWNITNLVRMGVLRKTPERRRWTDNFRWMGVRTRVELHDELQVWGKANHKSLREIQEEALEMYADLNIRPGVEPTDVERQPIVNARRARTKRSSEED
jgi:hypothetical protein